MEPKKEKDREAQAGRPAGLLTAQNPPFTPLVMFTSTLSAVLTNLEKINANDMIGLLVPGGNIRALNCNFGHTASPGWESYIKRPKEKKRDGRKVDVKKRKKQGDGTSFNSAIEPVVTIPRCGFAGTADEEPDKATKVYFIKCFPTTGITQVPGVLEDDARDGIEAIRVWADFLTANGRATPGTSVGIGRTDVFMRNFKFQLIRADGRIIVNRRALADLLRDTDLFAPYTVGQIKCALESSHISFACVDETGEVPKTVKVKIFMRGRVNILGAKTRTHGETIYRGLTRMFSGRWADIIELEPLPD